MTTMIGLPLVSILMFILAGILIGHLLWYHDRKIDLRRISKLEDRYQLAKGTALKRKQEFLRLQSEIGSHQNLLDQARREANAVLAKQRQADEDTRATKNRLLQFEREHGELTESIHTETRRNESLVAQLKEALQLKTEAEQRLTETSQSGESAEEISATYRDRIEQLQQENLQLADNYEQEIEKLRAAIAEQSTASAQTNREKESAIIRLKDELELQQNSRQQTTQTAQSVQQQVDTLGDELKEVQTERERLRSALEQKTEKLANLRNEQQELIKENEANFAEVSRKLATANRELEKATAQHHSSFADSSTPQLCQEELSQKLQAFDSMKEELEAARTQIVEQQANAEQQAKLIANQQSELKKQIDLAKSKQPAIIELGDQEKELHDLRASVQQIEAFHSERENLTTQLRDITARHDQLTHEVASKESRIVELSKSFAEFEATKQQLAESKQQVLVIAADRERLEQSHQLTSKEAESLRTKLAEQTRIMESLQEQLAGKDACINEIAAQTRESAKPLEIKSAAATKLSTELVAAENLRPANNELQQRLDELIKRLNLITTEHEDSLESNAKAENRIRDLQNQLHENAKTIRDQRRRLTATGDLPAAEAPPKDDRRAA